MFFHKTEPLCFFVFFAVSAAVDVKRRRAEGFRDAQLELSCSHPSECQDGAEQQEGQEECDDCVCVFEILLI